MRTLRMALRRTEGKVSAAWNGFLLIVAGGCLLALNSAQAAVPYFIHTDHLDTPRVIANSASQVVWRWDNLDPFGANAANENPSGLGVFTCNLRLPGQYFDQETGLHFNFHRDYDPSIGRYIQSDPIGLFGGINTYAYVGNNPLRFSDPLGLFPTSRPTMAQSPRSGIPTGAECAVSSSEQPGPKNCPPPDPDCFRDCMIGKRTAACAGWVALPPHPIAKAAVAAMCTAIIYPICVVECERKARCQFTQ